MELQRSTPNETRLIDLFTTFVKIGVFTFGGGYAMIPLIEREVVMRHKWIEQSEFLDLLTIAQSVPGPISLNSAAFIGYKSRGYIGALAALTGVVIPSFTIILVIAIFFGTIRDNAIVDAAFKAMRPVVVALIVAPTIGLIKGMSPITIVITLVVMALFAIFSISPALPILGVIVLALIWTYVTQLIDKRGGVKQ